SAPRLLVDVGWPGTLGMMRHSCKRMGIALEDIQCALATHYHMDHAGLVQELRQLGVHPVVMDTQRDGIPLLRTQVKPTDNYTDLELAGITTLSEDESRAFLAGI